MLRVFVAGDIRIYRDGVVAYLGGLPHFTVVGAGTTGEQTLELCRQSEPEVLVLDMAMQASLELVRELMRVATPIKVVALTVPDAERAIIACAEAGIAGYVSRDGSLEDVATAVERAARGEIAIPPSVAAGLYRRVAALAAALEVAGTNGAVVGGQGAELTPRERELMSLLERGLSNKQIAGQLGIEVATVKNHIHNILEKLHVRRRSEAVACVQRPTAIHPSVFDGTSRMMEPRSQVGGI